MKPLSPITDPKIAKAMAHPLRVRILSALEDGTASPNELSQSLDAPLGNVSYHVRQLADAGLIKMVDSQPRRGAVEHYYRLEVRPSITDEAWSRMPKIVKEAVLGAYLEQVYEHVNAAAASGGFERDFSHMSRLPLLLDEQGFKAAAKEVELLVAKLKRIEDGARKRLSRRDGDGEVRALGVLMLSEAAAPEKAKGTKRSGRPTRGKRPARQRVER